MAGSFFRFADFTFGSVASAVGEFISSRISNQAGWYEFSGSIDRAIDKAQMMRRLKKLAEGSHDA